MTGRDYLAPLVGALLYPDLAQRFWPDSVESFDRARAFESAWGAAWRDACGHGEGEALGNAFAADFDLQRLWQGPRATAVPHLLLNATRVGSGQRTVVASLAWPEDSAAFAGALDLLAAIDANPDGRDGSLPLVTAANLSARFPLVSPVGSLDVARGEREGLYRFGDGGYYENSGALTLRDLLAEIEPSLRLALGARPVIVQISNDVEAVQPPDAGPDPLLGETPHYLGELLSPLRVMLNTRSARGSEERLRLRALARERGWPYLHFRLCDDPTDAGEVEPPLGWTLSAAAQGSIDDHLSGRERCAAYGVDNVAYLEAILAALGGDFGPLEGFVPR
jgi:hypothetical protein